jgi:hypothetical protein
LVTQRSDNTAYQRKDGVIGRHPTLANYSLDSTPASVAVRPHQLASPARQRRSRHLVPLFKVFRFEKNRHPVVKLGHRSIENPQERVASFSEQTSSD